MAIHAVLIPPTQQLPLRKHLLYARDFTYTVSVHATVTKEVGTLIILAFR